MTSILLLSKIDLVYGVVSKKGNIILDENTLKRELKIRA